MGRLIPASILCYLTYSSEYNICKLDKKDGTKEEPCPEAVTIYNDVMGSVDGFDIKKRKIPNKKKIRKMVS
ncbi:hypothetical protein TNCV_3862251 [Trichonephila clavipes]|nr:hypothetical protein TNCV_3862251 [Trichonephila clavipes]